MTRVPPEGDESWDVTEMKRVINLWYCVVRPGVGKWLGIEGGEDSS